MSFSKAINVGGRQVVVQETAIDRLLGWINPQKALARLGSRALLEMHAREVLATCGQPVTREVTGVDHKYVGEYRIVEEWLYIIEKYGHKQMYLLKFDGDGLVREIKWMGEQK